MILENKTISNLIYKLIILSESNHLHSFFYTTLNGSKYCYVSLTIQLNISHLFTQLNIQTGLFLTIQFSISHLFALSLNFKHFYFKCQTVLFDPWIGSYQELQLSQNGLWSNGNSSNLQGRSLTIRLFNVTTGHSL